MRHRLFHAVVLAALPGCGSSTPPISPDVTKDSGTTIVTDSASTTDSSSSGPDTTAADSMMPVETGPDAKCYCAEGCLPCIK